MADGKPTDTGVDKADASGKLRADELELWDRVLNRWDKHTGRQVKFAVSAVTFVIVVVGFLGVRSLDSMVEETVRSGVEMAAAKVMANIEKDTERLSDQLGNRLATMIVEVAKLEQEADKARDLVTRMEEDAKHFGELDTEIRERMSITESRMKTFRVKFGDEFANLENGLKSTSEKIERRMAVFSTDFANLESELKATKEKIQSVKDDVGRVDRIAASVALAAAPSQNEDRLARKLPQLSELGPGVLDALTIRQVPTPLGKPSSGYDKQNYLLTFSAFVEETVPDQTARDLLDSIEKVTYVLSERWFKPNTRERSNRNDNFQFAVTVWGRTPVEAKAEFVQGSPPICWSGLMDLKKTIKLKPKPCD